jgi:hypothetical protein
MPEYLTLPLLATGGGILFIGLIWLLVVAFKTGFFLKALLPVLVILIGAGTALFIPVWNRLHPPPADTKGAGEQKKTQEGVVEERLTLTGAKREEYAKLVGRRFAVIQWANADVTDDDAATLADQTELREVKLNDAQVTDATLERLMKLPKLDKLYIARTKITPDAVVRLVFDNPASKVDEIDIGGLNVPGKAVRDWKNADKTRKANQ